MLKTIDIENIAVIEKTTVDFSHGLNVLTGETGAGKSIVVDSINAILGERTSKELVRYGSDNAFVSAYFEDISSVVTNKLNELGFDTEEDNSLLLTRKINSNGKSVCKINGKSATVSILKEIGTLLVNIHGQHDSQALLHPEYQYQYIDMLLDDKSVIEDYKTTFKELISVRRRLKSLTADNSDKAGQLELLNFQINEIEAADIQIGERERLHKRKELLNKSEYIVAALNNLLYSINGDDEIAGIKSISDNCFNSLSVFDEAKEICNALADVNDKIEYIKDEAEKLIEQAEFDPQELENIDERLNLYYEFSNKYASTEEGILSFLEDAKAKRDAITCANDELKYLSEQYNILLEQAVNKAEILSCERKKTAERFSQQVKKELEFLDMPKLSFVVEFEKGNLSSTGFDKIEFLISTNPGEPPKQLSKIASGGELSRIMLAIKNILSYNDTIDTLIFDEVDTGVSGRASEKIGLKLKSVSKNTQVICVTHSAQIASNADKHFLIQKDFQDNKTYTRVTPLDFEARKQELARIMGGLEITDSLLKSAEEMLSSH